MGTRPTISVGHFLVVKDGTAPEDNDDSFAADAKRGRFAIADGACESGFSKIWSRVLVDQYVRRFDGQADDWSQWFGSAQSQWRDELKDTAIPWYGQEQFERGAFATFLGLVLQNDEQDASIRYHAEAVGDSCLFHTRRGELLRAFPLEKSEEFNLFPKLVGSRTPVDEIVKDRTASMQGDIEADDRLLFMSDALAQWSLAETEAARPPWKEIDELVLDGCTDDQFEAWIGHLRTDRGLHNDDVTLMMLRFAK